MESAAQHRRAAACRHRCRARVGQAKPSQSGDVPHIVERDGH
jgi:hypothetical protein